VDGEIPSAAGRLGQDGGMKKVTSGKVQFRVVSQSYCGSTNPNLS
jgi:hypothetical protein